MYKPLFIYPSVIHRIVALSFLLLSGTLTAADNCAPTTEKQLFWGDLHIHTAYSLDAYLMGTRRGPKDAYAFAKGKPEKLSDGTMLTLDRPLDFAAVTDHGEYLAAATLCAAGQDSPMCRELDEGPQTGMKAFIKWIVMPLMHHKPLCPADEKTCSVAQTDAWQRIIQAAQEANEPCHFTTFIGSEWTATPNTLHWHRNLIFANDKVPAIPPNVLDQPTQEELWQELASVCDPASGCNVLAIPHNSNIGMGGSFSVDENNMEAQKLRARFERLAEVFQHKGQSECFPGSTLADEICDYEIVLPTPVRQRQMAKPGPLTEDEIAKVSAGYLRDTLGRGLMLTARYGFNPFRYGLIGSTDTHTGRAGYTPESGWVGTSGYDNTLEKRLSSRHYNPGGLVAVWAEANTRESIFSALERRETYATTGPRIALRFLQTFDPQLKICDGAPAGAVTMGSEFAPAKGQPRFAVQVMKDRHPLAQVDIIKLVWRDGEIKMSRHTDAPNSASSKGFSEHCVEWTDADYRPHEPALWYARILETPSPRWSSTDDAPEWVQERAWSSPIWSIPKPHSQETPSHD